MVVDLGEATWTDLTDGVHDPHVGNRPLVFTDPTGLRVTSQDDWGRWEQFQGDETRYGTICTGGRPCMGNDPLSDDHMTEILRESGMYVIPGTGVRGGIPGSDGIWGRGAQNMMAEFGTFWWDNWNSTAAAYGTALDGRIRSMLRRADFAIDDPVGFANAIASGILSNVDVVLDTPDKIINRLSDGNVKGAVEAHADGAAAAWELAALGVALRSVLGPKATTPRRANAAQRAAALERARGPDGKPRCVYCGTELERRAGSADSVEIDHIKAYARGGETVDSNLGAACRTCNRSKGAKEIGTEWVPLIWSDPTEGP